MSLLAPPVLARPEAPLARANPVAKLGIAFIVTAALLPTVDPVTPALLLVVELACLRLTGLRVGQLLRRGWPILVAALGVGVSNTLFAGDKTGTVLLDWWQITVTTGALADGASLAIRVIAIALPGVLALATTDPTDLADALVQQLRVPWRFAFGALAAMRLLPLFAAEWRTIGLARRARGLEAGRSPAAKVQLFGSQVFALLVGAIRRGVRMATAMDARGFGSRRGRTYARVRRMHSSDWGLLAAAVAVAVAATAVSIALGTWQLVLS